MKFEVVERQGDYTLPEYHVIAVASNKSRSLITVFQTDQAANELAEVLNHAALLLSWHKHPEGVGK